MWEAESRARLQAQRPLIAEAGHESASGVDVFVDILPPGSINTSTTVHGDDASTEQEGAMAPKHNDSLATDSGFTPSISSTSSIVGVSLEPTPLQQEDVTVPPMSSSLIEVISSIASIVSHETPLTTTLPEPQPTGEYPLTHASGPSPTPSSLSTQHGPSVSTVPQAHAYSSAVYTNVHSPMPSGESIFGTIMNRLTVLEANHTLYAQYVAEQTVGVRDVLRKLGEEVGRLESIVSAT